MVTLATMSEPDFTRLPDPGLDVFTAPQLDAELTRLTHEGRTSIVVDLSRVDFLDSTITRNSGSGVVAGGAGGTANVSLTGSMVSGNGTGVGALAAGTVYLTDTTVTRNATGLSAAGGTINTGGDNRLQNNTANGAFGPLVPKQ